MAPEQRQLALAAVGMVAVLARTTVARHACSLRAREASRGRRSVAATATAGTVRRATGAAAVSLRQLCTGAVTQLSSRRVVERARCVVRRSVRKAVRCTGGE